MPMIQTDPSTEPDEVALAHSQRLVARLQAEIHEAGGWISFARYMERVLYAPGLGYYTAGARKFGTAGDFVTAPELTPLFGQTVARQAAEVLTLAGGDILELGPGSGRLALDILRQLEALGGLPGRYLLLEVSADLRQRQQALFEAEAPHLLPRLVWLDSLPARHTGLILGNEVLDALPVHLVRWCGASLEERGVVASGGGFAWRDQCLTDAGLAAMAARLPVTGDEYLSEVCLALPALISSLAACLDQGVMLFIDYGFPRHEYYHPQRSQGTLMCHYRHRAHADPFQLPGLTDITAHVDFTLVAEAGTEADLTLLGYTGQAQFLMNCGLLESVSGLSHGTLDHLRTAAALQQLLQPSEMGELFKAIALGKGVEGPLLGFSRGDRSGRL